MQNLLPGSNSSLRISTFLEFSLGLYWRAYRRFSIIILSIFSVAAVTRFGVPTVAFLVDSWSHSQKITFFRFSNLVCSDLHQQN